MGEEVYSSSVSRRRDTARCQTSREEIGEIRRVRWLDGKKYEAVNIRNVPLVSPWNGRAGGGRG